MAVAGNSPKPVKRKKRISLFLPLKTFLPYLGILGGVLLFIFQQSFITYTEKIVGKALMEVIRFETRGKYTIDYSRARFNVFAKELHLSGFIVEADTSTLNTQVKQNNVNLYASVLTIDLSSFLAFLIDKRLAINGIELVDPKIAIGMVARESDTLTRKDVITKLDSYLEEFEINSLRITNADVAITSFETDTTKVYSVTGLSLEIHQLALQTSEPDIGNAFHSDHLELEILDESIKLVPGYTIAFDRFWASGRDSTLQIENLRIIPDQPGAGHSAYFPKIELSGLEILKFLNNKHFQADKLDFGSGLIETVLLPRNPSGKKPKLPGFLTSVNISEVTCDDLDLNLQFTMRETQELLEFENIDLSLRHLLVYDEYLQNPSLLLDRIDFDISVDRYSGMLADIEHAFTVDSAIISYRKGFMAVSNISVRPTNPRRANKVFVQSNGFTLQGLNFHDALLTGNLEADQVFIYDPNVRIVVSPGSQKREKSPIDYKNIYPLIRNIFPSFSIDSLRLIGGTIGVLDQNNRPIIKARDLYLELDQIRLDSTLATNPNQIFGARNIELHASDFYAHLERSGIELNSSTIKFDTREGLFLSKDLKFSKMSQSLDRIELEEIRVSGLNWFKVLHDNVIILDRILIQSPNVYIQKIDSLELPDEKIEISAAPNYPDSILVKSIEFRDGNIEIHKEGQTEVLVDDIQVFIYDFSAIKADTDMIWNARSTLYKNGAFALSFMDNSHEVTGNLVSYSSADSTFRMNQLSIRPKGKSDLKYEMNIGIPNLITTGTSITQFLDSGYLHIGKIMVLNPDIDVKVRNLSGEGGGKSEKEKSGTPPSIEVGTISVVNGELRAKVEDETEHQVSTPSFDLRINNIVVGPETRFDKTLSFFKNVEFESHSFSYSGLPQLDTLYLNSIDLNTNGHIALNQMVLGVNSNENTFYTRMKDLSLYGSDWLRKVLHSDYSFDSLYIGEPQLTISLADNGDKPQETDGKNTFQDSLYLSKIQLVSGSMDITIGEKTNSFPDFNIQVENLGYWANASNPLYSDDIRLEASNLRDMLGGDLNDLSIGNISLSTRDQTLRIENLSHKPKLEKLDYGWKVGKQTDWMDIENDWIQINGLDYESLIAHGILNIRELTANRLRMHVFRDKHVPFPEDQVRYMPQTMLRNIRMPVHIENLVVAECDITYEELDDEASYPGIIEFHKLTAGIHNITNDSARIAENPIMLVGSSTNIMESGKLQADFEFDLSDPDNGHTYRGFLTGLNFTDLNKILEPNVRVHVKSGVLDKMNMSVTGNDHYTLGSMDMYYNDLRIQVLRKEGGAKGMGPAFGTFFANTFFISRNNPKLLFVREGDIYAERDTAKSIFNYLSKTALSGVVSSIGARSNRKEIKKANKEAKEDRDEKRKKKHHYDVAAIKEN